MRTLTLLLLLPSAAFAATPDILESEFLRNLAFVRSQSASGNMSPADEMASAQNYYNRWQTLLDKGWAAWWWRQYFPSRYPNYPIPPEYRNLLPGGLSFTPYAPGSNGQSTLHLESGPLGADGMPAGSWTGPAFASVAYEMQGADGRWQTIGIASSAADSYGIDYTFADFEPILRTTLLDADGRPVSATDSSGRDLTHAYTLAVAVPVPDIPPATALLAGLGLLGLRRRLSRAASAPRPTRPRRLPSAR